MQCSARVAGYQWNTGEWHEIGRTRTRLSLLPRRDPVVVKLAQLQCHGQPEFFPIGLRLHEVAARPPRRYLKFCAAHIAPADVV